MARVSKNIVTKGMRGMLGGTVVFKKHGSGTIVSASPEKSSKQPSDKQLAQQTRFRLANVYAQKVKADPVLLRMYEDAAKAKSYPNVHSCIVADYFQIPEIVSLEKIVDETTSGNRIEVTAFDFMKVQSMTLTIRKPDGSVVETGKAEASLNQIVWSYPVSDDTELDPLTEVEVQATDLPGNVTKRTFVL